MAELLTTSLNYNSSDLISSTPVSANTFAAFSKSAVLITIEASSVPVASAYVYSILIPASDF